MSETASVDPESPQREIKEAGPLLTGQGDLAQVGWSRHPLLDCNLEEARFYRFRPVQRFRLKRWDYYGVTTPTTYFSATLADVGYLGSAFVCTIDTSTGEYQEGTLTIPLARGIRLPRNSHEGESCFDNGRVRLSFQAEREIRRLSVSWPGFGRRGLRAEILLRLPPSHESMTIVIPIGKKRFYYNRKVNCIPAEGWIERGEGREVLHSSSCLGNLDWGRGVWELDSSWVWASASGCLEDDNALGVNLGCGNTSAATENAIIHNGKIHKLARVEFDYSSADFMRPWRMEAQDGRLHLTFTPFNERVAKTDALLLRSEVHQMFGHHEGWVVLDEGERVEIRGLMGFAEEHRARW